jgi:hypothetical protein
MGKQILLISYTISMLLFACSLQPNKTPDISIIATPDIGIEIQNNNLLEVTAPDGWNSFKTTEIITLMIRNISDSKVFMDKDFGIRIFIFTSDQWVEIKNRSIYIGDDTIILEPTKKFDPLKVKAASLLPELPNSDTISFLRIFIVGRLLSNGIEKEISSYIDLTLKP